MALHEARGGRSGLPSGTSHLSPEGGVWLRGRAASWRRVQSPATGHCQGVCSLAPTPTLFYCSVSAQREETPAVLQPLHVIDFSFFVRVWFGLILLWFGLFLDLLQQRHGCFKLQNSSGGNVRGWVETPPWSNSLFTPHVTKTPFSCETKHDADQQVFAQPHLTCCDSCGSWWKALLVWNLNSTFNTSERRISFPSFQDKGG